LLNRPLCEWFLSHGADPNVQCTYGWTPLTTAVEIASRDIIDLLFEHGGSIEHGQLIHAATRRKLPDCMEVIQMMLDKGCDINTIQYHNHELSYGHWNLFMALGTPLHSAAEAGRIDVVKFLLDHGANPMLRDTWGALAIDRAKGKNHTEVVDLLESLSHSRPEVAASL
jgi:ankyrin repeat protein